MMSHQMRVLVVDDDPAQVSFLAGLIHSAAGWPDAAVHGADSYGAGLRALAATAYDVALFDDILGASNGLALLRDVRDRGVATPIIILTAHGAAEVAVAAMKAGAADCLDKASLTSESVVLALRHALTPSAAGNDRLRAEQARRGSDERFRALLEHSWDVLVLVDHEGRIVYSTPSCDRHLGWPPGDLLGRLVLEFVHPDDAALLLARLADGLASGGVPVSAELRVRHRDGTYRTIEGVAVNRLDEPAVGGIVVNARDVTDRRLLEEQLRQVYPMDAVGRLAGGIAHDFNNLLTAILGYCNLLLENPMTANAMRADLEEIRKAGDRAAALTRQLLAFSRRPMLRLEAIELSARVGELEPRLREVLGDSIELVLALAPDLPTVKADSASIEEILINLAVNARAAMPAGGQLTIETTSVDLQGGYIAAHPTVMAGGYVMLAVSDTGAGMDASIRTRVFEPFSTSGSQGQGGGLGLATVYGLVKQNGGYIWVYSEPGQGTVFKVYLPQFEARPGSRIEFHEQVDSTETVLVVEDEDGIRALSSDALRRRGYTVLAASDALDALRLVERHSGVIDVVITDVVMPHMTGGDLAQRIRQDQPSVKVLFMSGLREHTMIQRELAGGARFLQKPFSAAVLARTVRALLDEPAI